MFRKQAPVPAGPSPLMAADAQAKAESLVGALTASFPEDLLQAALYGSIVRGGYDPLRSDVNLLLVFRRIDPDVLGRLAPRLQEARLQFRCAALVLAEEELAPGAQAFPVKFFEIKRSCRVLHGADLLQGLSLSDRDLRRACRAQWLNVAMKLRRAYLLGAPDALLLQGALRVFVPQFLGALRVAAELERPEWFPLSAAAPAGEAADLADHGHGPDAGEEEMSAMPPEGATRLAAQAFGLGEEDLVFLGRLRQETAPPWADVDRAYGILVLSIAKLLRKDRG